VSVEILSFTMGASNLFVCIIVGQVVYLIRDKREQKNQVDAHRKHIEDIEKE